MNTVDLGPFLFLLRAPHLYEGGSEILVPIIPLGLVFPHRPAHHWLLAIGVPLQLASLWRGRSNIPPGSGLQARVYNLDGLVCC